MRNACGAAHPNHRAARQHAHAALRRRIAIAPHDGWRTPLGIAPVENKIRRRLVALNPELFQKQDTAHSRDHVLEVQLPFLQHMLQAAFSILPILFGQNSPDSYRQCAELLQPILTGGELLIASSNLSHEPNSRNAQTIDRQTLETHGYVRH